jgi:hypothetical protein
MARPLRDDLDHRRRQIGIGVDRKPVQSAQSDSDQNERQQGDEELLLEAYRDDPVDEGRAGRRRQVRSVRMVAHWLCMN